MSEGSRSSVGVGVGSIGGVLRGNSLFSADGAAVDVSWGLCGPLASCVRLVGRLVGKLLLVILLSRPLTPPV